MTETVQILDRFVLAPARDIGRAGAGASADPVARLMGAASLCAVLAMPPFIMHARSIADVLLCLVDVLFLAGCARRREWAWLRRGWVRLGAAWWAWLAVCSLPGIGAGGWFAFGSALAAVRFLLLVAALEQQVLATGAARRWLARVMAASALYIGLSSLLQLAAGRDLVGWPRSPDGELTGPFEHPRAGAPLSRLLFPVLLPPVDRLLAGPATQRLAAFALTAGSVATLVLIGQRMPVLLTVLGLVVASVMLPRLRAPLLAALAGGALLLAASATVSPPVWHRLVVKFSAQMEHFPDSDYGQILGRAVEIARQSPVVGRGFGGYRAVCPDPRTFVDPWTGRPDPQGAEHCNIHPHNHYLEAATDSGLPGLALFCALIAAWTRDLLRGIGGGGRSALRVGLFVAFLMQEWPIASASSFYAMDLSGFSFILLGWGLAEARHGSPSTAPTSPSDERPST